MVEVSRVTWGRAMIVLAVLTVVTAAVVVVVRVLVNPPAGRAPTGAPVDTSKSVLSTSTAVQTAALAPPPPGFPDLDGFTDVSADHKIDNHGIYPLGDVYEPDRFAVRDVEHPWRYGRILLRADPWPRSSSEPGLRGGL